MSISKSINKSLGKTSRYFCNQIRENGQRNMYHETRKPKEYETEEITTWEKIFKNQKIEVFFEGYKEDLSDLRLKVFVNDKMKFVSQEGMFIVSSVQFPKIVRKGWKVYFTYKKRKCLRFKYQEEYERFIAFTKELRDCTRVQDMYREQCLQYLIRIDRRNKAKDTSKPL